MNIELADFNDFQNCMSFNKNNEQELEDVERNTTFDRHERFDNFPPRHKPDGRTGGGMPLDSIPTPTPRYQLHTRRLSQETQPKLVPPPVRKAAPHPKPNPFGQAKPVDIVAHQLENEKKMIVINNTTIKTVGSAPEMTHLEKLPIKNTMESKSAEAAKPVDEVFLSSNKSGVTKKFTAAPMPQSIYSQNQSLAHLLSNPGTGSGTTTGSQKGRSPPQIAMKTTILKKKHPDPVSSTDEVVDPQASQPTAEDATPRKQSSEDLFINKGQTAAVSPESVSKVPVRILNEGVVDQHKNISPGIPKHHDKYDGKSKHRDRRQLNGDPKTSHSANLRKNDFKSEENQKRQLNENFDKGLGDNSQLSKPRRRQSGAGPEDSNSGMHSKSRKSSFKGADRPRRASIADERKNSAVKHLDVLQSKISKPIDKKPGNDSEKLVNVSPANAEDNTKLEDKPKPDQHGFPSRRIASQPKAKTDSSSSKEKADGKSKTQKAEQAITKSQALAKPVNSDDIRGEQDADQLARTESARGRGRGRGRGRRNSTGRGGRRGRGGHPRSVMVGHEDSQTSKSDVAMPAKSNE